jgi:hypothetical protein
VSERYATAVEVVKIGRELRAELERAAREEQRDVTSLARLIVRQWLDARRNRAVHDAR